MNPVGPGQSPSPLGYVFSLCHWLPLLPEACVIDSLCQLVCLQQYYHR